MKRSRFLREWDEAIEGAVLHNTTGEVWVLDEDPDGGRYPVARLAARTMHAAFMGARPSKYDPERDK